MKITSSFSWNYLSFACMAVAGIVLNLVIGFFFGSDGLGIFNQTYAIFVVASQFSVFGIHFSIITFSSKEDSELRLNRLLVSALISTFVISLMCFTLIFLLSSQISNLFDSYRLEISIKLISPALILFSLNKVLLSFLNGRNQLVDFAIGNIIRYVSLPIIAVFLIFSKTPIQYLSSIFIVSESMLILFCIYKCRFFLFVHSLSGLLKSMLAHISFGFKALFSGIFIELNSRLDVIILGIFVSDSIVGVYSFFSLISEGTYNIYVVVKNILNPRIARLLKDNNLSEIKVLIKKSIKWIYLSGFFLISIIGFGTYFLVSFLPDSISYMNLFEVLVILLSGLYIISAFIPFEMMLTLNGQPHIQSTQNMFVVIINLILNLLLIPMYGAIGAAFATVVSFIFGLALQRLLVKQYIGIKMF